MGVVTITSKNALIKFKVCGRYSLVYEHVYDNIVDKTAS